MTIKAAYSRGILQRLRCSRIFLDVMREMACLLAAQGLTLEISYSGQASCSQFRPGSMLPIDHMHYRCLALTISVLESAVSGFSIGEVLRELLRPPAPCIPEIRPLSNLNSLDPTQLFIRSNFCCSLTRPRERFEHVDISSTWHITYSFLLTGNRFFQRMIDQRTAVSSITEDSLSQGQLSVLMMVISQQTIQVSSLYRHLPHPPSLLLHHPPSNHINIPIHILHLTSRLLQHLHTLPYHILYSHHSRDPSNTHTGISSH